MVWQEKHAWEEGLPKHRVWQENMNEKGFNHKKVINPKRGVWFRDGCLTMIRWLTKGRWLTSRVYGYSKSVVFGPNRKILWMFDYWSVVCGEESLKLFDFNCTKVYEQRKILWITRAYIPYSKILRTRIGKSFSFFSVA